MKVVIGGGGGALIETKNRDDDFFQGFGQVQAALAGSIDLTVRFGRLQVGAKGVRQF